MISHIDLLTKLLLAILLGGVIGFEREAHHRHAGFRTHILVCLGAALFTITSIHSFNMDPARVAAGIVTGIGFLGAGTIIQARGHVRGLTTAASLWTVAGVGLAVGTGFYFAASITTLLVFVILMYARFLK